MNNNGVIIQATGNSLYGRFAFNLAMSIRANDRIIPITLICDEEGIKDLKPYMLNFFTEIKYINEKDITFKGKKHHFLLKTMLYNYSPYQNTLFLDADTIINPKRMISYLFGELQHYNFVTSNNGYFDFKKNQQTLSTKTYQYWGDIDKIKMYYDLRDRLWQVNSTIIYFSKSKEAKNIFNLAEEIYRDELSPKKENKWGFADEYCFNIALSKLQWEANKAPYNPIFIQFLGQRIDKNIILRDYWGFTNGGHRVNPLLIRLYNEMVNKYSESFQIMDRFFHVDKQNVIKERKP